MKHRRKGETEGRKLTPGERAINWAKAVAIIVPLFGAGWISNSDEVKSLYAEAVFPEERAEKVDETGIQKNVESSPSPAKTVCPAPQVIVKEARCIVDSSFFSQSMRDHEKRHHE